MTEPRFKYRAPYRVDPIVFQKMKALREEGKTYRAIAGELFLAVGTVHLWLNQKTNEKETHA